jgi:hypothetical protein
LLREFITPIILVSADVFPGTNDEPLVINYYDNYANCPVCQDPSYQFFAGESWGTTVSNEPFQKSDRVKGLTVASSVKVLGSNQWLHSVSYFNRHQQKIQAISTNPRGGTIRSSTLVDYSGKLLKSISVIDGITTTRRFDYDHAGRVLKTYHQINQQKEVVLSASEYNSLGQSIGLNLHSVNGEPYLQSVDYRQNIRGLPTRINNTQIAGNKDAGDPEPDYFAMEFDYTNSFGSGSSPRRDGLYSAVKWKSDLGKKEQVYNFDYGGLNFLTQASYKMKNNNHGSPSWSSWIGRYNETISYDLNGNILSLARNGDTTRTIDQLSYVYTNGNSSNQLQYVNDSQVAEGFNNGNAGTDDYAYDINGNLTQDKNKSINSILYNELDLVKKVLFGNGSYVENFYAADGSKVKTVFYNGVNQSTLKTEYAGNFVYMNDALQLIHHEEGRLVPPSYENLVANPTREANGTEGFTPSGNVTVYFRLSEW